MGVQAVGRLPRGTVDRHHPMQKFDDGSPENIVPVTRHHVTGTGHVDILAMGTDRQEVPGAIFAQQVG